MRLIDADELKNVIYESWGGDPYYHTSKGYPEKTETEIRAEEASLFLENIDAQPTIEAVPLEDYRSMEQTVYKLTQAIAEAEPTKHGRWIYDEKNGNYYCSECHRRGGVYIDEAKGVELLGNYCGNCGARMDEVEE